MRRLRIPVRAVLCATFIAASFVAAAQASDARGIFWRIGGDGDDGYLLGSIHYGTADMYPLAPALSTAFNNADTLVVEANILATDAAALSQLIASKGSLAGGKRLTDVVAPETWALLKKTGARYGMPPELFLGMKPWLASLTVSAMVLKAEGYDERYGIDYHFLKLAGGHKPVVELESVEEQIRMFDGFTPREQELLLQQSLSDGERGNQYVADMIDAWKRGDAAALEALVDSLSAPGADGRSLVKRLFDDRNKAMTAGIDRLLKQGKHPFVVVGAGHLVGENGVVKRLQAMGYHVVRP